MATLNKQSLEALIAGTAADDQDAFSELYRKTRAAVYAYALSILKNRHDAEDILHDCYLNVHKSAGLYRQGSNPMAWIMTIARNLCLQHLQRQKRTAELLQDLIPDGRITDPDDKLIVEACLNILSAQERQIVILHTVADFKHREIAGFMSLPLHTVITKYRRALKKMRAEL